MNELFEKYFNEYSRKARVYPMILCLAPLYISINPILIVLNASELAPKITIGSIMIVAAIHFGVDITRNIGRLIEKKVFENGNSFPTTNLLLSANNHFSKEAKREILLKIKNDFNIEMPSEAEQIKNELGSRKRINEAVGLIRQKVKDGRLLIKYNIRYGAWRNFIGGSFVSVLLCLINIILFSIGKDNQLLLISSVLCILYLGVLIFMKPLLHFFGGEYANQLFLEYLSLD